MSVFLQVISLSAAAAGAIIGLFIYSRPAKAIEIQKSFYEKINWRIEPISMHKEIRNTAAMGLFLLIFSLLSFAYIIINRR
jgi:hypothetical protein